MLSQKVIDENRIHDPNKHHQRSIQLQGYDYSTPGAYFITLCAYQRQCLFGDVVDGVMELNPLGQVVRSHWQNSPKHHPHLQLDEFIIMPNHLHGILILSNVSVGAGFNINLPQSTHNLSAQPAPTPQTNPPHVFDVNPTPFTDSPEMAGFDVNPTPFTNSPERAGFDVNQTPLIVKLLAKPAPTNHNSAISIQHSRLHGIPEIIRGFKTFSARRINQTQKTIGIPVWQRNYYEHIIRDDNALRTIRQYIQNNPRTWTEDQLHPQKPSKW